MDSMEQDGNDWIKVTEKNPGYNKIVWGIWKNKEVCLVQHSLTEDEYFEFCEDGLWYSFDDEKTGCVKAWKPIERPNMPENPCE